MVTGYKKNLSIYRSNFQKFAFLGLLVFGLFSPIFGQRIQPGPVDTLFLEDFQDFQFDIPLSVPTGGDDSWVNYNQSPWAGKCGYDEITGEIISTYGWYPDYDLIDPTFQNNVITSCSYTPIAINGDGPCGSRKNRNWLITPPILVSDLYTTLSWKSRSDNGPFYTDGYKVLISKTGNLPQDFTDTLFVAAECLPFTGQPTSINPDDYNFSPGYIHANGWTDTRYYQVLMDPSGNEYLSGILEPHTVNIDKYYNEIVYIAFLHDSYCNYILQLDDIVVSGSQTSPVQSLNNLTDFSISPNPCRESAQISFNLRQSTVLRASLRSAATGQVLQEVDLGKKSAGAFQIPVNMETYPAGIYVFTLITAEGVLSKMLVKE